MSDQNSSRAADGSEPAKTPPIFKPPPPPVPPTGPPPTLTHPIPGFPHRGHPATMSPLRRVQIFGSAIVFVVSVVLLAVGWLVAGAAWATTVGVVGLVICAILGVSFVFTGDRR